MFFCCHAFIGRELILIQDLLVVHNQFSKTCSCPSERLSFDPLQDVLIFAAIGSFSTQHISVTAGSKSVWYLHKLISYHLKFCAIEQIAEDLTSFGDFPVLQLSKAKIFGGRMDSGAKVFNIPYYFKGPAIVQIEISDVCVKA